MFPATRKMIKGFGEIITASDYWTKDRQKQMETGSVVRVDLLDKFFKIKQDKEIWDIRDIQSQASIAM